MYSWCNHQIGVISISLCWGLSKFSASFETDSKSLWTTVPLCRRELLKLFLPPSSVLLFVIQLLAVFVASGNPILSFCGINGLDSIWIRTDGTCLSAPGLFHLTTFVPSMLKQTTTLDSGVGAGAYNFTVCLHAAILYPFSRQQMHHCWHFPFLKLKLSQVWGRTPVMPAHGRQRHEDQKVKVSRGCTVSARPPWTTSNSIS